MIIGCRVTWFQRAFALLLSSTVATGAMAHGISAADKAAMLEGGALRYLQLGATHMVTGYDHLLFLLAVVFLLHNARDVIKFVTAFTIGHSITLIAATLGGISANYFLIDAVIAVSVCYKGFDNNGYFRSYLDVNAPPVLAMVMVFGLIHGFGLSTRLQQLPLGDDRMAIIGRILAFNVGIELGQVAALLVMILVLGWWRRSPRFAHHSRIANDGIIVVGVLLFLMQMHGYLHGTQADDLGFSTDLHNHAHADLDAAARAALPAPTIELHPHDNL
jgi:HupE / UreJ protein